MAAGSKTPNFFKNSNDNLKFTFDRLFGKNLTHLQRKALFTLSAVGEFSDSGRYAWNTGMVKSLSITFVKVISDVGFLTIITSECF